MKLGGIIRFTMVDFPDRLACVVFTVGCNFRCPFCYNKDLVLGTAKEEDIEAFFQWLERRRGKLDGVAITGGEPTLWKDLPEFIDRIKEMGFEVKLDTNGSNPDALEEILKTGNVDYIAMDVKAPLVPKEYARVTGGWSDVESIRRSIDIIMHAGIPYEFRTTVVPTLHDERSIESIGEAIRGARLWALQGFVPAETVLDPALRNEKAYPPWKIRELAEIARRFVEKVELRGV
ncbi:MAG: anaerobic ribonucleoside-triphosphate reductase activating protein [Candidatus Diapherotrites archaeon]|nr:anaerobic ribonucleoside-triphosphate reductase activating protein [Candidatus Diapherotrites archaeon]